MNLGLWCRTIRDIPPQQLAARVKFELKRRAFPKLPPSLRDRLALGILPPTPPLHKNYLNNLQIAIAEPIKTDITLEKKLHPLPTSISFTFLNETRILPYPIPWNSPDYTRLWQFNLHYFDWIREILVDAYTKDKLEAVSLSKLYYVTNNWIDSNPHFSFDGWHPYTTSLRIVNWTYALRAIPSLQTPKILNSLWSQVIYLHRNKEYFAGGNHLLENLRGLIVGGLNFNHPQAEQIVREALQELGQQLSEQILPDGGHYERSPMYHLLVMNLVGETIACCQNSIFQVPHTILDSLHKMLGFARGIRLANGSYPLWNDSAYKITYSLDETVSFVSSLLERCKQTDNAQPIPASNSINLLHQRLLSSQDLLLEVSNTKTATSTECRYESYHAPQTGYSILRNSEGIELGFDYGPPCPQELPPHAHADCLTIDVYYRGQPIIIDTGTSEYKSGEIRNAERSTRAHNTVEIGGCNQSEVWGSFRVGRKAQPLNTNFGTEKNVQWICASHNGYDRAPLYARHKRWIGLSQSQGFAIVIDILNSTLPTTYRSTFHFAPNLELNYQVDGDLYVTSSVQEKIFLKVLDICRPPETEPVKIKKVKSWYSPEFGERLDRTGIEFQGHLSGRQPTITSVILCFNREPKITIQKFDSKVILEIEDLILTLDDDEVFVSQ